MTSDERHRRMDAARAHAELSVQDLWLRYVALGGSGDAFEVDGYLQGLVPLGTFQQDILAQTLNEALDDGARAHYVPLSGPFTEDAGDAPDDRLGWVIDHLLGDPPPAASDAAEPPGDEPG